MAPQDHQRASARTPQNTEEGEIAQGIVGKEDPVCGAIGVHAGKTWIGNIESKEKPMDIVGERKHGKHDAKHGTGGPDPCRRFANLNTSRSQRARKAKRRQTCHGNVIAVPKITRKIKIGRIPFNGHDHGPQSEYYGYSRKTTLLDMWHLLLHTKR